MPSTSFLGPPSTNVYLDALQWGGWQWTDGAAAGTNITYYVAPGGVDIDAVLGPGAGGTSVGWFASEIAALQAALQSWANVASITFTQVFSDTGANLVEFLGLPTDGGTPPVQVLGLHETPESAFNSGFGAWGVFNYQGVGWDTAGLQAGGYGFVTLIHELGHALGLAHPHDDGGGSAQFPGVTGPGDLGSNNLNQGIFTTMSYNDGWTTGPSGLSTSYNYGWQSTPMAFDIAAIQALYGTNTTFHAGNDTYVLPDSNSAGAAWACIWDAGGTDTISYGGVRNVVINLTAATLDNTPTGGGVPSYASGVIGGFTIANGAVIENATGGSGDDMLIGNASANTLSGGGGSDTLVGGAGGDTLNGGGGTDTADYSTSTLGVQANLVTGAGSDGTGSETLISIENVFGGSGSDAFVGSAVSNTFEGNAGNDLFEGGLAQIISMVVSAPTQRLTAMARPASKLILRSL